MGLDTKSFVPDENISEEALAEMREKVLDSIIIARVGLLLRHPFFGNMATRLKIEACDDWCPTAATDGRHLYYNTQFFNTLSNKQIEFVIAHEILHCVYDHIFRREERDPQIYNIACDYIVNNTLVRDRIGDKVDQIPIYQDFKYEGWSSEEVYDDIFEKHDSEQLKQLGELLDDHVNWEDDGSEDGDGDGNGQGSGKGKGPPRKYSKEELRKIRDEIKENMIAAAQNAGAGNIPAGVERMIKDLTEPKMNWRELIRQEIQSVIKNDFTFARPNRKAMHSGAILPGMNFDKQIDICVALDMSGSIGNEQARDFLSEIQGIMEEFKEYRLQIWCFDTQVYAEDEFTSDDGRDILDYNIKGGGGTDFMCNWEHMKENDIVPKKFIMFTDGMPWNSWGDPDYCDTVFLIHSHGRRNIEAPFGQTAQYGDD